MNRVFLVVAALLLAPNAFSNGTWFRELRAVIHSQMNEKLDQYSHSIGLQSYQKDISISYIDPRLTLTPCEHQPFIEFSSAFKLGRLHIKVACNSPTKWAINVPVEIRLISEVLAFSRPIGKKSVINEDDITFVKADLSRLMNGYYLKKEDVIGKQSKRATQGNQIITPYILQPALMVRKGDNVIILAKNNAISVKMAGEALADGREGRQIRVKNRRSQRIIKARVVAPGLVEVDF